MIEWIILLLVAVVITGWAIVRKGVSGLPLIIGVWWLFLIAYLAYKWFPPTPSQLLVLGFLAGIAIGLIVWGLTNVIIQAKFYEEAISLKKELGGGNFIAISKERKAHYGVLYGYLPWNDEGAGYFASFVNENIWFKGYKITQLNIELDIVSGIRIAWIWGLIEPKTIIDRILY